MEVIHTPEPAAAAAELLLRLLRDAIAARGRGSLAVSGGSSPLPMFDVMVSQGDAIDWSLVDVFQVDERVAPDGDADRNAVGLRDRLTGPLGVPDGNVHVMPVADREPEQAARDYATILLDRLGDVAGDGAVIDVVHLGLGDDGHTASLVPGSPVLAATDDVVATELYRGRRRITMTAPLLNRARHRVWLVPAAGKGAALRALMDGSPTDPASLIVREGSTVVTDLKG